MKTVNLELSKQLKEAGYPQYSEFLWSKWHYGELEFGKGKEKYQGEYRLIQVPPFNDPENQYASPTADEILEQLPAQLKEEIQEPWLVCTKNKAKEWEVGYATNSGFENGHARDEELANACAKMWLYLKENNLLEVKG